MTRQGAGQSDRSDELSEESNPCNGNGHDPSNSVEGEPKRKREHRIFSAASCSDQPYACLEKGDGRILERKHPEIQPERKLHLQQTVADRMYNGGPVRQLIERCPPRNPTSVSRFFKWHSHTYGENCTGYAGYMRYALRKSPLNKGVVRSISKDYCTLPNRGLTKSETLTPQRYLPLNLKRFRQSTRLDSHCLTQSPAKGANYNGELLKSEGRSEEGIKVALLEVRILEMHMFLSVLLHKQRLVDIKTKGECQSRIQRNMIPESQEQQSVEREDRKKDKCFKGFPASTLCESVPEMFLPDTQTSKSTKEDEKHKAVKASDDISSNRGMSKAHTPLFSTCCCPMRGGGVATFQRTVAEKKIIPHSTDWVISVSLAANLKGIHLANTPNERRVTKLMLRGAPRPTDHATCLVHGIKNRILRAKEYLRSNGPAEDHTDVMLVSCSSRILQTGLESHQRPSGVLVRIPVTYEPLRIYIPMRKKGRKSPFLPSIRIKLSMLAGSAALPHEQDVSLGHCVLTLCRPVFAGVVPLYGSGEEPGCANGLAGCVRAVIACRGIRFPKESGEFQDHLPTTAQSSDIGHIDNCEDKTDLLSGTPPVLRLQDEHTVESDYATQTDCAILCVKELANHHSYEATLPPSEINEWITTYRQPYIHAKLPPSRDASSERAISEVPVEETKKAISWPSLQVENGPQLGVEQDTSVGDQFDGWTSPKDTFLSEQQQGRLTDNSQESHLTRTDALSINSFHRPGTMNSSMAGWHPHDTAPLVPSKQEENDVVLLPKIAGSNESKTQNELSPSFSSKNEWSRAYDGVVEKARGVCYRSSAAELVWRSTGQCKGHTQGKASKIWKYLVGNDAPVWWGKNRNLQLRHSTECYNHHSFVGVELSQAFSPGSSVVKNLEHQILQHTDSRRRDAEASKPPESSNPPFEKQYIHSTDLQLFSRPFQSSDELLYSTPPLTWPQNMATLRSHLVIKACLKVSKECSVVVVSVDGILKPSDLQDSKERPLVWKLVRKSALEDPEKYVEMILLHVRATVEQNLPTATSSNAIYTSREGSALMVHLHALYDDGKFIHIFREYIEPPGGLLSEVWSSLTRCRRNVESEAERGDARAVNARIRSFSENHAATIMRHLLLALHALHSRGEVYVQMTPKAVFITKEGHVKLSLPSHVRFARDTSFVALETTQRAAYILRTNGGSSHCRGIPLWTMSPEELDSVLYCTMTEMRNRDLFSSLAGASADIWRAGLIAFYLLTGSPPFVAAQRNTLMRLVFKRGSLGKLDVNA